MTSAPTHVNFHRERSHSMSDYLPHEDTFRSLAKEYALVPVFRRLAADTLTAVTAFDRLRSQGGAFLFESVVGGEHVGRYSFLSADPFLRFTATRDQLELVDATGRHTRQATNPLQDLRQLISQYQVAPVANLPPFVGGAVGYLGYDTIRYAEHLPDAPPDDRQLPDISLGFYDQMVVLDNAQKVLLVVALANLAEHGHDPDRARRHACRRVDALVGRLTATHPPLPFVEIPSILPAPRPAVANFSQPEFEAAVARCVDYIRAGDIFQVVISQRMQVPITADPLEIYRTLRTLNPSPFMFLLETPAATLVGSSPEIMCRVVDRRVTVRPLAGTRARGKSVEEDTALAAELKSDPKERAEHVMLVDLGRNDVGRVAKFGSVRLSDVMTVEKYSHVMHLTSNVTGELRSDQDAFDALMACLPAGTVSGAPKVRAMEIIDELEPHRRGPYAGAVGYVDFRGNMDTCITLRTIVVKDRVASVQAGAGIVADSDPASEYEETRNKARVLLRAIDITEDRCRPGAES